jgi:cytochrome c oxidase subunit 2
LPWFPEAASSYAADIDWLFLFITIIVGAWFVVAEVLLIYLVLRYLRRPGVRAAYLPARGLRSMSVVLIPCTVILGFDLVIDAVAAPIWDEVKQTLPPHDELVRVSGEQWAWRFTYPGPDGQLDTEDDVETVNERMSSTPSSFPSFVSSRTRFPVASSGAGSSRRRRGATRFPARRSAGSPTP